MKLIHLYNFKRLMEIIINIYEKYMGEYFGNQKKISDIINKMV